MRQAFTILLLVLFAAEFASGQGALEAEPTPSTAEALAGSTINISKRTKKVADLADKAALRAAKANIRATEATKSGRSINKTGEAAIAEKAAAEAKKASYDANNAAKALRAKPDDKESITNAKKAAREANMAAKAAEKAAADAFDKLIVINFKEKLPPEITLGKIEEGDFFRIRIDNINQNIWKVSLTKTDSIMSKPQQTPAFGTFNLETLSKLTASISPISSSVSPIALDIFKSNIRALDDLDFGGVAKRFSAARGTIEAERKLVNQYTDRITKITQTIDDLKLEVYELRLKSLRSENPDTFTFDFTKALTNVKQLRSELAQISAEFPITKEKYETFSKENEDQISSNADLAKADKIIKDNYAGYGAALTAIQSSITADKINELLAPLVSIENNKVNTYFSLPIQFMGEQTRVQLSIIPRNDALNQHSYSMPITFPTIIQKYTSVGISFYSASIYDRAYSTTEHYNPEDSTSTFTFDKEHVDKAEIGLAAMLRYGRKTGEKNNFGYHGSIGAGISMSNKIKPRALFGGGFSHGKKHMLATDIGLIAGYVDKHSGKIIEGKSYTKVPNNLTVSRIGFGVFGAIGYLYQF